MKPHMEPATFERLSINMSHLLQLILSIAALGTTHIFRSFKRKITMIVSMFEWSGIGTG